jgi:uncharacterized protein YprB with RNaseH-like and TPR domain
MPLQHYIRHLPHIGPQHEKTLRLEGCACWADIVSAPHPLAGLDVFAWDEICRAVERSLRALEADDAAYFTLRLPPLEQWRVLAHWYERASYFDIETSGLEADSIVTLVCCFHDGRPLRFMAHENLDDFLDLLEKVKLLVSFNGASFDVPRVLGRFHIPELPCPHIDLRWLCHHAGWRGGLKKIERALGLRRPSDLEGLGGAEAVWLWQAWQERGDEQAKRTLERYCAADTVMLKLLAGRLCALQGAEVTLPLEAEVWTLVHAAFPDLGRSLASAPPAAEPPPPKPSPPKIVAADLFSIAEMVGGAEGLSRADKQARLRERWRKHTGGLS